MRSANNNENDKAAAAAPEQQRPRPNPIRAPDRRSVSAPTSGVVAAPVAPQSMTDRSERGGENAAAAATAAGPSSSRSSGSSRRTSSAGHLKAPGDLGRAVSRSDSLRKREQQVRHQQQQRRQSSSGDSSSATHRRVVTSPTALRMQQRAMDLIRKQHLTSLDDLQQLEEAATASDGGTDAVHSDCGPSGTDKTAPVTSKVTALTYRGMEVMFGTTSSGAGDAVGDKCYVVCSRSRHVFQTLDFPKATTPQHQQPQSAPAPIKIARMVSNPTTGQVAVATADGMLQTYHPEPVDPTDVSFGRYRWRNGPAVDLLRTFEEEAADAAGAGFAGGRDSTLDVALTQDWKILVTRRSQMAVFDATPYFSSYRPQRSHCEPYREPQPHERRGTAELLWTTRLASKISAAKISGDGEAIAVVLEEGDGVNSNDNTSGDEDEELSHGVYTFERDHEDGSSDVILPAGSSTPIHLHQQHLPPPRGSIPEMASLARSRSVGIVYKPGPFLSHASRVTRLSFRGLGHNTSNVHNIDQGNDLLLTYCADNVARIYGQNAWRLVTEWTTPPRTRVDWIRGVAAFTLGDLESQKKSKSTGGTRSRSNSPPPSRRPSLNGRVSPSSEAEAINETLGRRQHYQSIPSHATPSSNAGAWISELTFHGRCPAIRLSRLTYLKRGMDELNPTLFENVSSYLPPGFLFEEPILRSDVSGFSVEGIWPAWNPWLSETAESDNTETLRGSAMAFLGLSSGPGAGNTGSSSFGNSLLGSMQSPPSELRIIAAHPSSGKLVALEFPLLGEDDWTALELGNPKKSILMLSELDPQDVDSGIQDVVSMDYESSYLVARVAKSEPRRVTFAWQKKGSLSLLPSMWVPEDAEPSRAVKVLSEQRCFKDDSLVRVPLSIPCVDLPPDSGCDDTESILSLAWWPEHHFGAPPLLAALTSAGSVIVFELPPPWSSHDAVTLRSDGPVPDLPMGPDGVDPDEKNQNEVLYDVLITPDPEYGLGLRLEVQRDGMPAVAGSFKKHPLNGEPLPAEKTGMVNLGDELVSANGVSLEYKIFDDIIATVRDLGAQCSPGHPMRLRFRHKTPLEPAPGPASPQRRSMEEMLGLRTAQSAPAGMEDMSSPSSPHQLKDQARQPVDMGFIVGVFKNAFSSALTDIEESSLDNCSFTLLPRFSLEDQEPHSLERSAVFFLVIDSVVSSLLVNIDLSEEGQPSQSYALGNWKLPVSDEKHHSITSAGIIKADAASFCIAVCDSAGDVRIVVSTIEDDEQESGPTMVFQHYDAFRLQDGSMSNLVLRASKVELIGIMRTDDDGAADEIHIWSASPRPLCPKVNHLTREGTQEYSSTRLHADTPDVFLDFAFINSGFLDSSQSLVAFTRKQALLFSRHAGSDAWLPSLQIAYNPIPGSLPHSSPESLEKVVMSGREGVRSVLRHLVPSMLLAYSSLDERQLLRSDWHPESVLSYIFTDERGPKVALSDRVRSLFLWLCSEGKDIPEDHHREAPLVVAPLPILAENTQSENDTGPSGTDNFTAPFTSPTSSRPDETALLRGLLSVLSQHCAKSGVDRTTPSSLNDAALQVDLPPLVESLVPEDVHVLRACCDLLLNPPAFKSVDHMGEHFLASVDLLRKLQGFDDMALVRSNGLGFSNPHVLVKKRSSLSDSSSKDVASVASSGSLAALLSNSQARLIECCKRTDYKLDWPMARQLRLPFWVRSDTALARLSEEIGQTIFREKKDMLECALFFIIAKKMRTLKNLAATDQSDSGRKFFKFLTSYDFSSDRGRKAAEKNAFSLLRKCQYRAAAAFFLLAEPPALNSALETIATKLRDMDLAFLVARLVESKDLVMNATQGSLPISSFGGAGVFGGGGGYASSIVNDESSTPAEELKFTEWKPRLQPAAHKLLINRLLPMSSDDPSLTAVKLLWLDKKEEAAWCLSGIIRADGGTPIPSSGNQNAWSNQVARLSTGNAVTRATEKANSIIDLVSAPSLLKVMKCSSRARFASALLVASTLATNGVELSAIQTILQYTDPFDPEEKENDAEKADSSKPTFSSQQLENDNRPAASSSIFGGYDVPVPSSKATARAATKGEAKSSIFDSYDVPTVAKKTAKASPTNGQMQSSIFDAFDAPKSVSTAAPGSDHGAMNSSIFDSYDAAPSKSQGTTAIAPQTGGMQSSIFDDYDVPPPSPQKASPPAPSGQMESSIFDSFETAPQTPAKPAPSQAPSSSSIFDSYDVPSQTTIGTSGMLGSETSAKKEANLVEDLPQIDLEIPKAATPRLWVEWRKSVLVSAAARRLIRETSSVLAQFHGDPPDPYIPEFYESDDPLVPCGASGILQVPCDADDILGRVQKSLEELCSASGLDKDSIVQGALELLGPAHQQKRTLFAVTLHAATGRNELAEDALRAAAFGVMQLCRSFALSFDNLVHKRKTRSHASSQFLRRRAARASWQLETCLWLHRGGGLPLSGFALKEAIVAVRIGFLIASWNRNHECLEVMIRSDPDCHLDDDIARHLWTSLKMVTSSSYADQFETKKTSSGGWEFLVDCRRSEATQMLRERRTGCFIIRPHSGDHGVFTLSFKTNLVPAVDDARRKDRTPDTSGDELTDDDGINRPPKSSKRSVRKDDVVQHAIIRLSESGYRCGSFGPYTTLISLLEAVSDSLPFNLRFDLPPSNRVIKEEGSQPSPNAVFLRKLALAHADSMVSSPPSQEHESPRHFTVDGLASKDKRGNASTFLERQASFGLFLELLVLHSVRAQLSKVVAAKYDDCPAPSQSDDDEVIECISDASSGENGRDIGTRTAYLHDSLALVYRMLSPLSAWCRSLELLAADILAPELSHLTGMVDTSPVDLAESTDAIEAAPPTGVCGIDGGDALLRRMIQKDSGVEFSTLRLVDGGECTIVVIFSQKDTVNWLLSSGLEETEADALRRLERVEKRRVIEAIDLSGLKLKQKESVIAGDGTRYRILDPWEVEALQNWEGETLGASVGRERYLGFNLGKVGLASEHIFRSLGGLPLLALWTSTKGGVVMTKALATVHPPWERAVGGDLLFNNGTVTEPPPFENSIRQHLYRNALFRRLGMPQRFMALVQVELLDLKNLTAPGGSLAMSVYALLRLKREGSTAALTNKARTLDTAATHPVKLGKSSGPNAPASWGSVVRFRFPLPENATTDGISFDSDRELLFKGPPCVLQVSVYEKKLLVDYSLGTADIRTDGLWAGGQLEEWVPLRSDKHGISWFARIRLTLRYELMCLASEDASGSQDLGAAAPSVGLRKIQQLSQAGGSAHEDVKRSASSPDLLTYFESMVY